MFCLLHFIFFLLSFGFFCLPLPPFFTFDKSDYNYKITVTGGKERVSYEYGNHNFVVPSAKTTKITIKDQVTKSNRPVVITLINDTYPEAKAPTAKTTDKLYCGLINPDGTPKVQTLTYKVSSDKYDYAYLYCEGDDYYGFAEKVRKITDSAFDLDVRYVVEYTKPTKYSVVYGSMQNGKFVPETKAGSITIKGVKQSAFKPATSYTLNTNNSIYINLTGRPDNIPVAYSELQNANVGG